MSRCSECGAALERGTAFCDGCGSPVAARRPRKAFWFGLAGALLFIVGVGLWVWWGSYGPGSYTASRPDVARLATDSPVETALQLSREGWPGHADAVVLVVSNDSAAAAVAGPLASSLDAPLLLTAPDALPMDVGGRIGELAPKRVLLVYRSGSIAPSVGTALRAVGVPVEEIVAADPFQLANMVAMACVTSGVSRDIAVVRADDDSGLALASAYASPLGMPVVFADAQGAIRLDASTLQAVHPSVVLLMGDRQAVPDAALAAAGLQAAMTDRVTGASAQDLSTKLAEYAFARGFEYTTVFAVRGADRAHAYAEGAFVAHVARKSNGALSPLILVGDDALGASALGFLNNHASAIGSVRFLGPGGVMASAAESAASAAAETRISKKAVVVDGRLSGDLLSYAPDRIVFANTTTVAQLVRPGQVLVSGVQGAAAHGFLVKVESVAREGETLVARTMLASLADIVVKGSLDARVTPSLPISGDTTTATLHAGTVVAAAYEQGSSTVLDGVYRPTSSPASLSPVDFADKRLSPPDIRLKWPTLGGSYDRNGGKISVAVDQEDRWQVALVLSATWQDFTVQKFALVSTVVHESTLTVSVTSEIKLDQTHEKIPVDIPLPKMQVTPTAGGWFTIVFVPVYVEGYVEPVGGVSAAVSGTLQFERTDLTRWELGLDYARGRTPEVKPIATVDHPPTKWEAGVSGSMEFKLSGGVKIGTRLYDGVGPFIRGELYGKVVFNSGQLLKIGPDGPEVPVTDSGANITLSAGLEGAIGAALQIPILGVGIGEGELPPVGFEWVIHRWPTETTAQPAPAQTVSDGRSTLDAMLVIDSSASMGDPDKSGVEKIANARTAGQAVVDVLSDPGVAGERDRLGIVSFSSRVVDNQPLTTDYSALGEALQSIAANENTDLEAGLDAALSRLEVSATKKRIIILVSDGAPNLGQTSLPGLADSGLRVLQRAEAAGIPIYTIGYGTDDAGTALLRSIAEKTGGQVFIESSAQDVSNALARRFVRIAEIASNARVISEQSVSLKRGEPARIAQFTVASSDESKTVDLRVMVGARDRDTAIWLVDPEGIEVVNGAYQGGEVVEGRVLRRFRIASAKPGDYGLYAEAPIAPAAEASVAVDVTGPTTTAPGADSDQVGTYVVVSETTATGLPRAALGRVGQARGVLPVWLWPTYGVVGLLLIGAGTGVALSWRRQR